MNPRLIDTSELSWLRIRGDDADSFLQGQLSNDLRKLTAQEAQLSSYNSPKGRMLAVLFLVRAGTDILIELPRSIADATLARLKMFVLRSKVTIAKADDLDALALIGDDAPATLAAHGLPVPDTARQCRQSASALIVVRRLGSPARFTLIGPRDAIAALRAQLPHAMDAADGWRRADIESGIPVVLPETRDHFVAQMANLDLLGGISFDKGCYTGQEIVARLHYLGQLKRRMFVARIDGPVPPSGSAVHADGDSQATGEIVDAVADRDGALATVVLQLAARDAALSVDGARLHIIGGPPA